MPSGSAIFQDARWKPLLSSRAVKGGFPLSEAVGVYDTADGRTLETVEPEEDLVFSHGSLTLDSIIVNGNGIVGMVGLQKAGVADRYRDLASILSSLEEEGVEGSELIGLLGIDVDEDRLDFFRQLGRLDSGASG